MRASNTAPFARVATAYVMDARNIEHEDESVDAAHWMCHNEHTSLPQLLQVVIDPHTKTCPKIAYSKPLNEMEPFAKTIAIEGA